MMTNVNSSNIVGFIQESVSRSKSEPDKKNYYDIDK